MQFSGSILNEFTMKTITKRRKFAKKTQLWQQIWENGENGEKGNQPEQAGTHLLHAAIDIAATAAAAAAAATTSAVWFNIPSWEGEKKLIRPLEKWMGQPASQPWANFEPTRRRQLTTMSS